MEKFNLNDFTKGWFIGNFDPTLIDTNNFEIAIKRYKSGDVDGSHHHKKSTEYTVIVEGIVTMNGSVFKTNDIIKINPNESTNFICLTDVVTVVVKTPSVKNDKFND